MSDTTLPAPLVPAEAQELRWHAYEQRKAAFLTERPDATADEIEEALKRFADELEL